MDVAQQTSKQIAVDTQQVGMSAELVGTWSCYNGLMQQERWAIDNSALQIPNAPAWAGGCEQQDSIIGFVPTSSQCDIRWLATDEKYSSGIAGRFASGLSRLVLNDDLTGTIQLGLLRDLFDGGGDRYVDPVAITWNMSGYQFTLDGTPMHRIAFEVSQGNEFFSYYSDDENRTTCQRN